MSESSPSVSSAGVSGPAAGCFPAAGISVVLWVTGFWVAKDPPGIESGTSTVSLVESAAEGDGDAAAATGKTAAAVGDVGGVAAAGAAGAAASTGGAAGI